MNAPVVHFEVNGRDAVALQRFYSELFGWATQAVPGDYFQVDTGANSEVRGGIGKARGVEGVTFYVKVPDLATSLARVEQLGGRTVMPPSEVGDARLAAFVDPEGHYIGLMEG